MKLRYPTHQQHALIKRMRFSNGWTAEQLCEKFPQLDPVAIHKICQELPMCYTNTHGAIPVEFGSKTVPYYKDEFWEIPKYEYNKALEGERGR